MAIDTYRFYALDATRGMAAVGIVFFHSTLSPDSFWSLVDYFFVLSGFVLFRNYSKVSEVPLNRFLKNRYLYFSKLALISIFVTYSVYFFQVFWENTTNQIGDKPAALPGAISSVPFAILLFQIFSKSVQLVNQPLWSLSAEIFANIFAAIVSFRNWKLLTLLYGLFTFYFLFKFITSTDDNEGVLGWLAIYRALIGFYVGLIAREIFEKHKFQKVRFRISFIFILPLFVLSQICVKYFDKISLLFIPFIFGLLIILIASTEESKSCSYRAVCKLLGKYSVGIYILQSPVEPVSAFITDKVLSELSGTSIYLFIYSLIKIFLSVLATYILERSLVYLKICSRNFKKL